MNRLAHDLHRLTTGVMRRLVAVFKGDYRGRLYGEQAYYRHCEAVHELPPIFHYWSNRYLLPMQESFGFRNPEDFFLHYTLRQFALPGCNNLRIASLGAGNCDLEVGLASALTKTEGAPFVIDCVDINRHMLKRGRGGAKHAGVENHLRFQDHDLNTWSPEAGYDVVIANQTLHHVLELEHLFEAIKRHLRPNGVFLIADTIGRNGHRRWPEAMRVIRSFWGELPAEYRYNHQLRHTEPQPVDRDFSVGGFEGIRAQDILPLLVESFHFELFLPYAAIVLTFVDRGFGPNFDPDKEWDRDFIDRVQARDEEGMLSGELKPTQMLAVVRNEPAEIRLLHPGLTPELCIRDPGKPPHD